MVCWLFCLLNLNVWSPQLLLQRVLLGLKVLQINHKRIQHRLMLILQCLLPRRVLLNLLFKHLNLLIKQCHLSFHFVPLFPRLKLSFLRLIVEITVFFYKEWVAAFMLESWVCFGIPFAWVDEFLLSCLNKVRHRLKVTTLRVEHFRRNHRITARIEVLWGVVIRIVPLLLWRRLQKVTVILGL